MKLFNSPSFGAKINLDEAKLIWDGPDRSVQAENNVKLLFNLLGQCDEFKKVAEDTPDNIEVDARVSNFSPGMFYAGVGKKEDGEYTDIIYLPVVNLNKQKITSFIDSVVSLIKKTNEQ